MLNNFLSGAVSMGFAVAALMFLKFWNRTRDGLFLAFAGSFFLLGLAQTLLTFTPQTAEERSSLFLLRLAAFVLIIAAFGWKNRARRNG